MVHSPPKGGVLVIVVIMKTIISIKFVCNEKMLMCFVESFCIAHKTKSSCYSIPKTS